ncbi:MAG: hypothetical protein VX463_06430, partial [Pseudomonadota bacterium]|nr:hypothetical protein [Pseudomonadota bacterium]
MTDQADIAAPTGAAPAAAPATPAAPAAPASPAPAPQAAEAPAAGEAAPGADALSPEALSPHALSPDALAAADPSALPAVDPAPGMTDALAAVLPPDLAREASGLLVELADKGGPAGMVIAGLSVAARAVILWKIWRLFRLGAWSRGAAARAL